jgi:Ni,Fe-hydrogenase III small subunit
MGLRTSAAKLVTVTCFAATSFCSGANAKDLDALARLLVPAYIAQNFAVMCNSENAKPTPEQKNRMITISTFVDHVKTEVTTGLQEKEADEVRASAANTARNIARNEMLFLGAHGRYVPTDTLVRWCERSAETVISEILQVHAKKHEDFDRLADDAKK